jgi:hypothetical protein
VESGSSGLLKMNELLKNKDAQSAPNSRLPDFLYAVCTRFFYRLLFALLLTLFWGSNMRHGENYPYEIFKRNSKTLESVSTGQVVMGSSEAILAVDLLNERLTKQERDAGWGYFHQPTTKRPPPRHRSRSNYKPSPRKR